jgi:TetR/AcrR family transcriptional regulator, mexJK operon transcriptional repressor
MRPPAAGKSASKAYEAEASASPRRGGRPSRLESEQLREHILDTATREFLLHGYGATSIEAVAREARISKRTFYHRFDDKPALFAAVVHRIIDRLRPPAGMPRLSGGTLAEILEVLARLILRAALAPEAVALSRLIASESARFPELAAAVNAEGSKQEAIRLITGLLERERAVGRLALDDPAFAAEQFLYMVMTVPQRRAMGLGAPLSPSELDAWAANVVALFLYGCRGAQETKETKRGPR